jgi:hypothetical protein
LALLIPSISIFAADLNVFRNIYPNTSVSRQNLMPRGTTFLLWVPASLAMNDVARPNKNPDNGIFWFWATGYPYQTTGRRPLKVDAATLSSV